LNIWKKKIFFPDFHSRSWRKRKKRIFQKWRFPVNDTWLWDVWRYWWSNCFSYLTSVYTAPRYKSQTLLQTPRQLFAARAIGQQQITGFCDAKVLRDLLIVTTKIKLIRRGEVVIFTKLSLQREFNIHASVLPSH